VVKLVAREHSSDVIKKYLQKHWEHDFHLTEFAFYETLGVLKRKWLKEEITKNQYTGAVFLLGSYIGEAQLQIDSDYRPPQRWIFGELRELVN